MEKYIYLNDIDNITEDDLINKYQSLCEETGAFEYKDRIDDYLYLALFNFEGYFISYSTSALASLELYAKAIEDYDNALNIFRKIYSKQEADLSFSELVESVGLFNVFDPECYNLLNIIVDK